MKLEDIFAKARAAHQQGRIAEAEKLYLDTLRKQPSHIEALGLLGAIELQSGRAASAAQHFAKALKVNPNSPVLHSNRSLALRELKRYDEALAECERALALRPDYGAARYNRALILQDLGRFQDALAGYDRVLAADPGNVRALNNRGLVLQDLKQYQAALGAFDRALAADPHNAETHNNRGAALRNLLVSEDALVSFDRAIALRPDYALAYYNRGLVLQDLKRTDEAFQSYERALALKPDYPEALNNRGLMLRDQRRNEDALADFDRALALKPEYVEALNNRGSILQELHRDDEALEVFGRMLALQQDNEKGFNNRGHALRGLQRYEEALASYDQAIALNPQYGEAQFNAALCRLLLGRWEEGWSQYEWRWHGRPQREFTQPLWLGGQPLIGKTVLLHAEQGFGDTIQIVRYVDMVIDLGAQVILEVQAPLKDIMQTQFTRACVLAFGESLPSFDFHCPLMSLPLAFKTTLDTIPRPTAYLKADPALVEKWQAKLGSQSRPRIGLVWSGSGEYVNDYNRSVLLTDLDRLLAMPCDFVSLQKEIRDHDREALTVRSGIRHFGPELTSFAETAALAACMDQIISVDTAVAHLASALGRPTWILLKSEPDWRWLLDRSDSVWYPTATLFRQQSPGNWSKVISEIADRLSSSWPTR